MVYVLLCFSVVWNVVILPIFFRVTSLALGQSYDCPSGQSYDCPSASEATMENMANKCHDFTLNYNILQQGKVRQNLAHYLWNVLYIKIYIGICLKHCKTATESHKLMTHFVTKNDNIKYIYEKYFHLKISHCQQLMNWGVNKFANHSTFPNVCDYMQIFVFSSKFCLTTIYLTISKH